MALQTFTPNEKMITRLTRHLFFLALISLCSFLLPSDIVHAQDKTIKIGYAHGLELFQENETLKQTLSALNHELKTSNLPLSLYRPLTRFRRLKNKN